MFAARRVVRRRRLRTAGTNATAADPALVPRWPAMAPLIRYLRANPQAFVLLVICVVLGLGTFIAVLIAVAGSGGPQVSGEPSGAITAVVALLR